MGHTRRQLAIARAITAADDRVDALMITGNPEAAQLRQPPRTDLITLPTVAKDRRGQYVPRRQGCGLDGLLALRERMISAALPAYDPHLLVVDKVAGGLRDELLSALRSLRTAGHSRIVLGLREVLDDPATVRQEWQAARTPQLIRDFYDEVWVYGDPTIFDPVREYGWAHDIADKVSYLGYLGPADPDGPGLDSTHRSVPPREPYVLCQLGGGQDGYRLAETFVRADLPAGHLGIVLTGPYLSAAERDRLQIAAGPRIRIVDFVSNAEDFVAGASAVVSMAGYNSTVELLATSLPVLLVPREVPRTEQLIRAERLAAVGCVDLVRIASLTPAGVGAWLSEAVSRPEVERSDVDLAGLERIPESMLRLVEGVRHAA